jgi:hypothetical protein
VYYRDLRGLKRGFEVRAIIFLAAVALIIVHANEILNDAGVLIALTTGVL